jgi:hypothetical protein
MRSLALSGDVLLMNPGDIEAAGLTVTQWLLLGTCYPT